jgi:hypothetical protein
MKESKNTKPSASWHWVMIWRSESAL